MWTKLPFNRIFLVSLPQNYNLMKAIHFTAALALCAALGLAGCGGTPSNSDTADETSGTETSEKVLNIATIGETTTLSPLYMIADNRPTQKLLYEGLVKYVDGEIQPVLAEDWELSEDGTQLTFYLRQGVTFHDGTPCDAEAVKASGSPPTGNLRLPIKAET